MYIWMYVLACMYVIYVYVRTYVCMYVYVCVCLYSTNGRPILLLEGTPQMIKKETFGMYA
jgi:hypothetical protein